MEPRNRHIPPCPFCGNKEAPRIEGINLNSHRGHRRVYCDPEHKSKGCGALGPPVHYNNDLTDSITRCVELWSRRALNG